MKCYVIKEWSKGKGENEVYLEKNKLILDKINKNTSALINKSISSIYSSAKKGNKIIFFDKNNKVKYLKVLSFKEINNKLEMEIKELELNKKEWNEYFKIIEEKKKQLTNNNEQNRKAFSIICLKNILEILKKSKQLILQGPPGTGKTRLAKQMAIKMIDSNLAIDTNEDIKSSLSKINNEQIKLIQFYPSYSYEDFVRGIVAKANGVQIEYKAENKILAEMAKKALDNPDKKYILIIDEINRANLSSVLGELIYSLEYRDEAVESMYEVDGNKEIILPSNLYIIGTMNTADRSIGHIDYAIRRRFVFESILPDEDNIELEKGKELFNKVKKLFKTDDKKIASTLSPEFNPYDVMLGHSYFIADNDDELDNKLKYQVIPLLKEYVKDGVLNESALKEIESL